MKRLVDTKFTEEQEKFINLAEGEVWTSNIKCPNCGSDCSDINEKTIVIGTYTQRYGLIDHNAYFEPFHIEYYDSIKNTNRYAFPDFYLPDTNEIIELKSTYTLDGKIQEMKDKFKAYEELGYKPKLLLDWEFVDIDKLEENLIKTNGLN